MTTTNTTDAEKQRIIDEEHLKLLRIGYLVSGGATCFFALIPLIYVAMGIIIMTAAPNHAPRPGEPPPAFIGAIFAVVGGMISLFLGIEGALKLLVARSLARRRNRMFCMVMAAISSFSMPYGTMLGVFSFMLLTRASVQDMFNGSSSKNSFTHSFATSSNSAELPAGEPRPYVSLFDNQETSERQKQFVERDRE